MNVPKRAVGTRAWALGNACRGMVLAFSVWGAGNAVQFLHLGDLAQLCATFAATLGAVIHLAVLRLVDQGDERGTSVLLGSSTVIVAALALLETGAGTLLVASFGCTYVALLGVVGSRRGRRWQVVAAALFPFILAARHAVRPAELGPDPLETAFVGAAGAVAVLALSSWARSLLDALAVVRDQALEASLAKERFVQNLSHELRTPLSAIVGYTEILLEDAQAEAVRADLESIRTASHHLLGLVSDVLELGRVEAGVSSLDLRPVTLRQLADEVAATARPLASARGNQLVVEVDGPEPGIVTDPGKLRQVLLNLLGNAARFTEQGTITLRVGPEGRGLLAEVRDTGIGIPRERLGDVFGRFVQVDPTAAPLPGGAGLGLAVAKSLVELMGGKIEVESRVGAGSTFRVRLPTLAPG